MPTAHLLIVTGLSGAGKTQAMKVLEDLGFFCIDNLPPTFLPQLTKLSELAVDHGQRIAVAMDVRGRSMFADLFSALDQPPGGRRAAPDPLPRLRRRRAGAALLRDPAPSPHRRTATASTSRSRRSGGCWPRCATAPTCCSTPRT
jgi:hypothetical protein